MHTHGENDKTYIIHGGKRDEKCYIIPKCFYYTWQDIVRKKNDTTTSSTSITFRDNFFHVTIKHFDQLPCPWICVNENEKKNTWLTAHFAIKRKNSSGIPGMISSAVFARCKNFWVHTQMKSLFIINVMGFVKKSKYYCGILLKNGKKITIMFWL